MIRKFVITAAALALPFSVLAAGSAHAGAAKIDVSQDSITCNTVGGVATIKPALSGTGTATSTLITVKGFVGGCQSDGPGAVTVLGGTFSGKLAGTSNNCSSLLGTNPTTGTLTIKWKADKTTPLLQTSTTVTVTALTGGAFNGAVGQWGASYGQFDLTATSSGAFSAGAAATTTAVTTEDFNAILGGCAMPKGLKTLHLGLGVISVGSVI